MYLWAILAIGAASAASFIYMSRLFQRNPGFAPWADEEADKEALLAGQISNWPSKDELDALLRKAGLRTVKGAYSIRLEECGNFIFRDLGGPAPPSITASHDSAQELARISAKVSNALTEGGVRHRFEIYDGDERLTAEFGLE